MNKVTIRNVLLVLLVGGIGYVVWTIAQAFLAGERSIAKLIAAPFNAAGAAWDAVAKMFGGSASAAPQNITLTDSQGNPIGTVLAGSPFNGLFTANPLDVTAPVTTDYAQGQASIWDFSNYPANP